MIVRCIKQERTGKLSTRVLALESAVDTVLTSESLCHLRLSSDENRLKNQKMRDWIHGYRMDSPIRRAAWRLFLIREEQVRKRLCRHHLRRWAKSTRS